eukprot:TRINITY_DN45874_c0_g1_i1.p1 TRINITY_DN45874_c0_g1~~TRINITY_DN45874_c0_g1_i1.p1  ORF type:complete len:299 (-),score=17.46 TRINITY_DN45874_c0_g1_i1:49-888(-)
MISSNDRVPLSMLLEFLSQVPQRIPLGEDELQHNFHVVVPLALKVGQTLSDMQKMLTGGVSGHWAALNFNFRTRQIEFFDPKGDNLDGAGHLGGFVARPTQFELSAADACSDSLNTVGESSASRGVDDLVFKTFNQMDMQPWWRSLRSKLRGSGSFRLLPREFVHLLKSLAHTQMKETSKFPVDLRWLVEWGFDMDSVVESAEQLQFDHESCPSFAIWFALQRGCEGKKLSLESFVACMRAKLIQLSGMRIVAGMNGPVAEAGIKAWREQLAKSLTAKL